MAINVRSWDAIACGPWWDRPGLAHVHVPHVAEGAKTVLTALPAHGPTWAVPSRQREPVERDPRVSWRDGGDGHL